MNFEVDLEHFAILFLAGFAAGFALMLADGFVAKVEQWINAPAAALPSAATSY